MSVVEGGRGSGWARSRCTCAGERGRLTRWLPSGTWPEVVSRLGPPLVRIVDVRHDADRTLVVVRLPEGLTAPLAPASLLAGQLSVARLDAVLAEDGGTTTFRTSDALGRDSVGRDLGFQQWWVPEAYEAVVDTARRWERLEAPTPEHHEHCLLDWTTIESGEDGGSGWESDGQWICDDCFSRFFLGDELGLRGHG